MKIESDAIYEHQKYDEVLVVGISREFESYDVNDDSGVEIGVFVRYTDRWDGYGSLFGAIRSDRVDDFLSNCGDKLRDFDRETPDS